MDAVLYIKNGNYNAETGEEQKNVWIHAYELVNKGYRYKRQHNNNSENINRRRINRRCAHYITSRCSASVTVAATPTVHG